MRSIATITRNAVVIGVLGIAATSVAGPTFTAWAQPSDGGCCTSTPSDPSGGFGGGLTPSRTGGFGLPGLSTDPNARGDGGGTPAGQRPKIEPPEAQVGGSRTVVVERKAPEPEPEVPQSIPDPVTPSFEPVPVPIPEPTVAPVPVAVEQGPVAPAPAPVVVPAPPVAPVVSESPAYRVLFTSSLAPGTQAATIILLFTVVGVWLYSNQIIAQWNRGGKTRARASA